jgi:hypothetical protein
MDRKLLTKANEVFYEWEKCAFPDGSPLSDNDRLLWIEGWCHGYLFINSRDEPDEPQPETKPD